MPRSSLYRLLAVALIAHLVIPSARADDASDFAQMQIREQAGPLFDSAAQEFSVPADLLRAYAFVHTRWSLPAVTDDPAHTPAIYGIMGLHDGREGWFINQLGRAAKLLGVSEDQIRHDLRTNVRAAAALLSDAARQRGIEGEVVESWVPAVEASSAIPMASPVDRFARKTEAYDVLDVLHRGQDGNGIRIAARPLDLRRAFSTSDLSLMRAPSVNAAEIAPAGSDYPQALWNPTTCFESRAGAATTHIAIHTMQGYYASTISWFKNCRNEVSAHYLVRSSDGQIKQMVHESDMAWHVRPIANPYTVGIEHEGFITDPIKVPTGLVILKIEERFEAGQATYEEVKDNIKEKLSAPKMDPKIREYMTRLREEAFLQIKDGYVDSGAAPGKDTRWKDVAQLKPATTTKEEVASRVKKRKKILFIPIPGTSQTPAPAATAPQTSPTGPTPPPAPAASPIKQ